MKHCGHCGMMGHNARTCRDKKTYLAKVQPAGALTQKEYADIRVARDHGMTSLDVASAGLYKLLEVNYAFGAPTYDFYLRDRRRRQNQSRPSMTEEEREEARERKRLVQLEAGAKSFVTIE